MFSFSFVVLECLYLIHLGVGVGDAAAKMRAGWK